MLPLSEDGSMFAQILYEYPKSMQASLGKLNVERAWKVILTRFNEAWDLEKDKADCSIRRTNMYRVVKKTFNRSIQC